MPPTEQNHGMKLNIDIKLNYSQRTASVCLYIALGFGFILYT